MTFIEMCNQVTRKVKTSITMKTHIIYSSWFSLLSTRGQIDDVQILDVKKNQKPYHTYDIYIVVFHLPHVLFHMLYQVTFHQCELFYVSLNLLPG